MTMNARTLVWCSGEDTMVMPIEIPPFLDVVLTLSAMLALFAYVYRLAGKEGPPRNRATTYKRGAGMNDTPTTP
jgi:hypothetical protein